MCGIFCVVAERGRFRRDDIARATQSLTHRGPDATNVERMIASDDREIWFGHTRLSIVDPTDAARQPMRGSRGGREGVIVYNGEVFNHRELAPRVRRGSALQSSSDTEVLLDGLLLEGPRFLKDVNGMFAFVLFDATDGSLLVARDRMGKKPLFVYDANGVLAFASELKAFAELGLPLTIDEDALAHYRWLGYVPAERCIYSECRKMPAASWARVDALGPRPSVEPTLFWDPFAAMGEQYRGSYADAVDELAWFVAEATRLRCIADVPVGVFLSGGVDSNVVAAHAARNAATDAFVVKPLDERIDESPIALRSAERYGLHARTCELGASDYEPQLAKLGATFDEPMADLSQLAVMANAEFASARVRVVLTGDGGDEVFLGYPWMAYPRTLVGVRDAVSRIPGATQAARKALATTVAERTARHAATFLGLNAETTAQKLALVDRALGGADASELYEPFVVNRAREDLDVHERAVIGEDSFATHVQRWYPRYDWAAWRSRTVPERLGALELVTYLRDAILVKVDRATMAYGLEARSPLLDHRIVELGMRLPRSFKWKSGTSKRILRDVCARRAGRDVAGLRKQGFAIVPPEGISSSASRPAEWNAAFEALWSARWPGAGRSSGFTTAVTAPTSPPQEHASQSGT